jgi:hypothetical protein
MYIYIYVYIYVYVFIYVYIYIYLYTYRLSVSFAIAQSAVLAIFEARIESKTEGYRYIPEALAARGKVKLSAKQLGMYCTPGVSCLRLTFYINALNCCVH